MRRDAVSPLDAPVRRVVTGEDAEGRSRIVEDGTVEPFVSGLLGGTVFHRLWGADGTPAAPGDGAVPAHRGFFPPPAGFRVAMFTVPPEGGSPPAVPDPAAARREVDGALPGLLDHMEREAPGFHRTATVDVVFVVEGEAWLELDDGDEVRLAAGDCVVQNGTRHRWRNHGAETTRLLAFLVGAHQRFDRSPAIR